MSTPESIPEQLADEPLSTKLVWMAIATVEKGEPITASEIMDRMDLSPATVYPTLHELEERELIESRLDVENPPQTLYYR